MFKRSEKVIYPKHGAGKIVKVQEETIGDKKSKYYKIQFLNSSVTVLVPIDRAKELGMRYPLSRRGTKEVLNKLNRKVKIDRKTLTTLDAISKERLGSGKLEDVVSLVNLLRSLAKQKEEENKNFSYSYSDRLEIAMDFIKSEAEIVLGKKAAEKYDLEK
ncbi:CarD family transcriptional regulator [Patescibacteria group bacterium]